MIPKKKEEFIIRYASKVCDLGRFIAGMSEKGLCFLALGDSAEELLKQLAEQFPEAQLVPAATELSGTVKKITSLLNGESRDLNLPLDLCGTPFQLKVWKALAEIPYGSTLTYSELAEHIGCPKSVRAAANGCGANPVGVVVPCHRVIRKDGSLGGYRGGIERKKILLKREKSHGQ